MSVCLSVCSQRWSQAGGGASTERLSCVIGILAIVAAQIYSHHLDHDKENCQELSMTSTQLGFCVYLALTAGIFGLAALFVSSLTLILTRDNGYQTLKESPVCKF